MDTLLISDTINQKITDQKPFDKATAAFKLSAEQKAKVLGLVNSKPEIPAIKDLVQNIFNKSIDGRSFEAKAIKEYLATLNVKTKSSFDQKYHGEIVILTDDQKIYIRNNASTMTIIEMARALFHKQNISKINLEFKVIDEFLKSINIMPFSPTTMVNAQGERIIPRTIEQAARRVNKYVLNGVDVKTLKKDTRIQNYLQALIKYCHTPRYALMLTTLGGQVDGDLFESSFVRYVWDKPDLMEEEVDTYINLCCDIVNYTKMQREIEKLTEMRDKCLDDSEGKRLSMALVTQMGELYKEMDNNNKRQNAALKALNGTRNDRLEGKLKEAASVLQLIEAWRDEQKRERLLKLSELRKQMIKNEVGRLDSLDAFKAELLGLNRNAF